MSFGIVLDLFLACLLALAIGYAFLLERRLRTLRRDAAQLEGLVVGLAETSMRAEAGIAGLREAAEQVGGHLHQKVELGQSICEDIAYMLERGGNLADRLEDALRAGREAESRAAAQAAADDNRVAFPSRSERDLRRALEARR
jgi:Domain of unknown function (DUF6468)